MGEDAPAGTVLGLDAPTVTCTGDEAPAVAGTGVETPRTCLRPVLADRPSHSSSPTLCLSALPYRAPSGTSTDTYPYPTTDPP